jgi:hypothetical protein
MGLLASKAELENALELCDWVTTADGTAVAGGTFGDALGTDSDNIGEIKAAGGENTYHVVKVIMATLHTADATQDITIEVRSGDGSTKKWPFKFGNAAKRGDVIGIVFPGKGLIMNANEGVNAYCTTAGNGSVMVTVGGATIGA